MRIFVVYLIIVVVFSFADASVLTREKRAPCSPVYIRVCELQSLCTNGGSCAVRQEEGKCFAACDCPTGYTGKRCEIEPVLDPVNTTNCVNDTCLTDSPCNNGGSCLWNQSSCSASCVCPPPYSGATCNDNTSTTSTPTSGGQSCGTDICRGSSGICKNGGTCMFNAACDVTCRCLPEYTGGFCETPLTICEAGFVCIHGRCNKDNDGSVSCKCDDGFYGTFCHIPCPRDCGENGTCYRVNDTASFQCNCQYPYTGDFCQDILPSPSPPTACSLSPITTTSTTAITQAIVATLWNVYRAM